MYAVAFWFLIIVQKLRQWKCNIRKVRRREKLYRYEFGDKGKKTKKVRIFLESGLCLRLLNTAHFRLCWEDIKYPLLYISSLYDVCRWKLIHLKIKRPHRDTMMVEVLLATKLQILQSGMYPNEKWWRIAKASYIRGIFFLVHIIYKTRVDRKTTGYINTQVRKLRGKWKLQTGMNWFFSELDQK